MYYANSFPLLIKVFEMAFVLNELRPTKKPLVMNLLAQAGMNVDSWAVGFKGKSPAANPKYCYNWSFEQPGEFVVACLWFQNLISSDGTAVYKTRPGSRGARRTDPGSNVWNRRAAEFDRHLALAYRQKLPVIAIIGDGTQRNPKDAKPRASEVSARLLDSVNWAVTDYDPAKGEFVIVRGATPIAPAVEAPDVEMAWFEGSRRRLFVYHRRREAAARRAKIADTLARKKGRLVCEVPKCGFDFAKRYGELGIGYAQVHHKLALSKAPREGQKTKLTDLAIVCANCHVMIHRNGDCRPLEWLLLA